MRITVFVIKILLLAAFFIVSNQNLALIEEGNLEIFYEEYSDWAKSVFVELGTVTGYIVDVEWLPDLSEGEDAVSGNKVGF